MLQEECFFSTRNLSPKGVETFQEIGNGHLVVFIKEAIERAKITKDEMNAIYLHEVGHVVNGDIVDPALTDEENLVKEIKADLYSVEYGSNPEVLKSGILKMLDAVIEIAGEMMEKTKEEVETSKEMVLSLPAVSERIEALDRMVKLTA